MKKCIVLLALVLGGVIMFSFTANAESLGTNNSVYASKTEQKAIYEIIQKSENFMLQLNYDGISILNESITPVYVASFLEYAETGVFKIRQHTTEKNGEIYIAKTVTPDGLFAGNIQFYIEDGFAYTMGFTPTPVLEHYFDPDYGFGANETLVSRSYADHARRIQNLTNSESFVSAVEVRYVSVEQLGEVFYINDGKTEVLVSIAADGNVFSEGDGEIVYIGDDLKKKADEKLVKYNKHLEYVEEWKSSNPHMELPPGSGNINAMSFSVNNLNVDNILNISSYLNLDTGLNSTSGANNYKWLLFVTIPIVIFAVFMGAKFFHKNKKVKISDN